MSLLADLTTFGKYSRYRPDKLRREQWPEIVQRVAEMHMRKFPDWALEIEECFDFVHDKMVMPSMRSAQFAGRPIEIAANRIYNCAFACMDAPESFQEAMFLLLGGTGFGYSVQHRHVSMLPAVRGPSRRNRRHVVGDSIEGWADAIKVLTKAYFEGKSTPVFDFSDIRPKGADLVTSGGKAPGPQPLKDCIHNVTKVLDGSTGRQLRPIEVHDILCYMADAVLAGGIRRAAMIALFSPEDDEMIAAKSGPWWETNPQRGRANNSAVLVRGQVSREQFDSIFARLQASGSGEPGFYWTNDPDYGTNPSLRAGTRVLTGEGVKNIEDLQDQSFLVPTLSSEWAPAKCWKSSPSELLYRLKFRGGAEYYATAQHEWPVLEGDSYRKVRSDELVAGMRMPSPAKKDKLPEARSQLSRDDGFFVGWLCGDGWITKRGDTGVQQIGLCVSKQDEHEGVVSKLVGVLSRLGSNASFGNTRRGVRELHTAHREVNTLLEQAGFTGKQDGLPSSIWAGCTESFRKGFIEGLFSADGSVSDNRVTLTTAHKQLVEDVRDLLGFYGIHSSIQHRKTKLPGRAKIYTRYDLRINRRADIAHFAKLFCLSGDKGAWLQKFTHKRQLVNYQELVSVELTDISEPVWDISVADHDHCFELPSVVTGNCAEIALKDMGFCNLTTINAELIKTQEDLNKAAACAAMIGTLQATYTDFHYLREQWRINAEDEALLGVSITGIASGNLDGLDLTEAADCAVAANAVWAKRLGINPAKRITTIKPEGTSSLVCGTSSGIHAWHAPYYIRRLRFGRDEIIAKALADQAPDLLVDDVQNPAQVILEYPVKAPDGAVIRTESAEELLERIRKYSNQWVKPGHISGPNTHNVSATVSVRESEWDIVREWMWSNRDVYNGISILPYSDHTYTQAPFEDIDAEEYQRRARLIPEGFEFPAEYRDETTLQAEIACGGGGSCEVI
jgi:hypothetical protein